MADTCVDDMFHGCSQRMAETVKKRFFPRENTGMFADVWKNAEDCATQNLKQKDPEDQALTEDHMQAICVYTAQYKDFYKTFNQHVRRNRTIYGTHFQFHSLHFWLTSALQILNGNVKCHHTYRRTDVKVTAEVNQTIRFGFFACSSYKPSLVHFGNESCFRIYTCSGGFMKKYSAFWRDEQEVLIPPYETFRVTEIKSSSGDTELADCKTAELRAI